MTRGLREAEGVDGCFGLLSNDRGETAEMRVPDVVLVSRAVVEMAAIVQRAVGQTLDGSGRSRRWPACPAHSGEHPLRPALTDRVATWACPESGEVVARIGGLVEIEDAARFWESVIVARMGWFARYEGLDPEEARRLAKQEGRPVRIVGPDGSRRQSLVFDRLNLLLGPDGEFVGMDPG